MERLCRGIAHRLDTDRERSEWAVYSRRLPGRGQGKTQAELEVSKRGGEGGVMNRNSRNSRNKLPWKETLRHNEPGGQMYVV